MPARDHHGGKSVRLRSTGELGASIVWVDAGGPSGWKTSLATDLGFRVAEEERFQYYPDRAEVSDETLYAPRAGLAFRSPRASRARSRSAWASR